MNDNKKIAFNSVIIFIRLCIVSFVSIIASRVVLDALGASDYGLYNVVGGIMVIINVVNMSMSSSTYRYIAAEMGKGTEGNINKIFNISVSNHRLLAFIILLLALTIGELYLFWGLNVEDGKFQDAFILYHITVASSAISTCLVPYRGILIAYEQFVATATIEIVANLCRLIALFTLLTIFTDRLICYGLIMFFTTLFDCCGYYLYAQFKYGNEIRKQKYTDKVSNQEMLAFSGWTSLGAFSNVAYTQVTAMLINFFFGTIVNAAFAVGNQINNFIITFANSLNQASVPQITKNFSAGIPIRSLNLTARVSKYTFFLMIFVSFPILMELDFLLAIWLKHVPEGANIYCALICLSGLLSCIGQGTNSLVAATGKIKFFQIITAFITFVTLFSGWLCFYFGANAYALSIVICITRFISIIVNVYLLKRILDFDVKGFYDVAYKRMFYVSIPLCITYLLYNPSSFSTQGHLIGLSLSAIIPILIILLLGLDNKERDLISSLFHKYITF